MTTSKAVEKQEAKDEAPAAPFEGTVVRAGALMPASTYGVPQRVSDVIQTPEAWSEYDQVKLDDIVGRDLVIQDVMFLPSLDREGEEWCIILFADAETGEQATTATGGQIVLRKLHTLSERERPDGQMGLFPIVGQFRKHPSRIKGQSDYIDLI